MPFSACTPLPLDLRGGQTTTIMIIVIVIIIMMMIIMMMTTRANNNANNNFNSNNTNNNRTKRRNCSLYRELSPTCTLKWPGRNRVQTSCNTSGAHHVQHIVYHVI